MKEEEVAQKNPGHT